MDILNSFQLIFMKRNFDAVHEQLITALLAAMQEPNRAIRYTYCLHLTESAITQMKEMILADPFSSPEEEVLYMVYEAPILYSQLYYYRAQLEFKDWRTYAGASWSDLRPRQITERPSQVTWTSSKINLIALLYVLTLAGCFNKNTLKEVIESFEGQLKLDLGQYHSALNKASFHKDPAAWLRTLPDILTQKFDSLLD